MMNNDSLPSAFQPEMGCESATHAPSFVSRITARVLGALIGAQVLRLEEHPGESIERIDRVISAAVDASIEYIDIAEVKNAANARAREKSAQANDRLERLNDDESLLISQYRAAVKIKGRDLTPDAFALWLVTQEGTSDE